MIFLLWNKINKPKPQGNETRLVLDDPFAASLILAAISVLTGALFKRK